MIKHGCDIEWKCDACKADACIYCGNIVQYSQKAVSCDGCSRWQHIACESIMDEVQYDKICLLGGEHFKWKCKHCSCAAADTSQKGSTERTRARKAKKKVGRGNRKKKKDRKIKGDITLGYFNIEGSIKKNWNDILNHVQDRKWDIMCITETHWRDRYQGRSINGYNKKVTNRLKEARKGGGIVIYWRNELPVEEWEGLSTNKDRQWIKISHGGDKELCICTVYMAVDKTEHDEENDMLIQLLKGKVDYLDRDNNKVIVLGDMNAHFKHLDGLRENGNSKRLDELIGQGRGLSMVNGSQKCEGVFTWQRNNSKTVIDYVLVGKDNVELVEHLKIDDRGEIPIASDHNVLELNLKLGEILETPVFEEDKWDIKDASNWEGFTEFLEHKVGTWKILEGNEGGDPSLDILSEWMTEAGEKFIGVKQKKGKWKKPRKLRTETIRRNILAKVWKKSLSDHSPGDVVEQN